MTNEIPVRTFVQPSAYCNILYFGKPLSNKADEIWARFKMFGVFLTYPIIGLRLPSGLIVSYVLLYYDKSFTQELCITLLMNTQHI